MSKGGQRRAKAGSSRPDRHCTPVKRHFSHAASSLFLLLSEHSPLLLSLSFPNHSTPSVHSIRHFITSSAWSKTKQYRKRNPYILSPQFTLPPATARSSVPCSPLRSHAGRVE